jgi:hypothetical protein
VKSELAKIVFDSGQVLTLEWSGRREELILKLWAPTGKAVLLEGTSVLGRHSVEEVIAPLLKTSLAAWRGLHTDRKCPVCQVPACNFVRVEAEK